MYDHLWLDRIVDGCARHHMPAGFDFETCSESWLALTVTGGTDAKQPDDDSMGGGDDSGDGQCTDPWSSLFWTCNVGIIKWYLKLKPIACGFIFFWCFEALAVSQRGDRLMVQDVVESVQINQRKAWKMFKRNQAGWSPLRVGASMREIKW